MRDLDKAAMGQRIRQIRLDASLRQWELAERLGTTQSAIHKYERGVVPEPRRLIEISRVGNTSVEWILTGRHGEDGSEDRERVEPTLLELARRLGGLDEGERNAVDEALDILERAVDAARRNPENRDVAQDAPGTARLLSRARDIHRSVLRGLADRAGARLEAVGDQGRAQP